MKKYNNKDRDNITPIEKENERDESYVPDNPQIELSRTKNNYHTVRPQGSYLDKIQERISTLNRKSAVRKDAVLMCSFIISSDNKFFSQLSEGDRYAFFYEATEYFAEHYGSENIISAVVHMDETTPHMHLNLVPIFEGKLCAKDLFNRKRLRDLQTNFWEEFGKRWGLMRGKSGSQAVHLSTAEFKAKKIMEQAEQRAAESEERKRRQDREYEQKKSEMKAMDEKKAREEKEIEVMSTQKESLSKDIAELTGIHDAAEEAKAQPLPKKRKEREQEITTLRAENAAFREEQKRTYREMEGMFSKWQAAEKRSKNNESALRTLVEMQMAYPDELNDLMERSKRKMNPTLYSSGKSNGNSSGYSK